MSSCELRLRPHHGMCMAYFQGHGYNEAFTAHMTTLIRQLTLSPMRVRLTVGGDDVCSHCPNLLEGHCTSCGKVEAYDHAVLNCCGLQEGTVLEAGDFFQLVRKQILEPGKRSEICGNCQWNALCLGKPLNFLQNFS